MVWVHLNVGNLEKTHNALGWPFGSLSLMRYGYKNAHSASEHEYLLI